MTSASTPELARLNVARLVAPPGSPLLGDLAADLEQINGLAEASPGFVWRLRTSDGDAAALRPFGEGILVDLSVWTDTESLRRFVRESDDADILHRRREWLEIVPPPVAPGA